MNQTALARQGKACRVEVDTPQLCLNMTLAAPTHLRQSDLEFLRYAMMTYAELCLNAARPRLEKS